MPSGQAMWLEQGKMQFDYYNQIALLPRVVVAVAVEYYLPCGVLAVHCLVIDAY